MEIWGFVACTWHVSVVGINLSTNEGIKLGLSDREFFGATLGSMVGVTLVTYVGSDLGSLEGYTEGYVDGRFYGLLDQWVDLSS